MSTYEEFSQRTSSEKIVLCHIEPSQRLILWTLDSGAIYKRTTDYFVINIKTGQTSLIEASSASLNQGEWYYDLESGICYVRMSDDSNPNINNISAYYRQFFSNTPISLPYDLVSGADVPYAGYLRSNSNIKKELDEEQTGIALESSTKILLENNDGYFDESYDTLFYENKRLAIYSWNTRIPMSEKQLLFDGEIQDKSFSSSVVGFNCKDFMYKLRERVSLDLFSSLDGTISETLNATPKRRIYGKVDNVKCAPVDNTLDGYTLTGTLSGSGSVITGVDTLFLDELSPGDELKIVLPNEAIDISIEAITDNTTLTLTEDVLTDFAGQTVTVKPTRPWRKKNRNWHIAGHKLRAPVTTVLSATQPNRIIVVDGSDMFDDDLIDIDGFDVNIKRIVGNSVVLRQNIPTGTPSGGESVSKNPVSKAYINKNESFINRDWDVTNTTESILNFTNEAEFNIAPKRSLGGTLTFTSGSRSITGTGVNFNDYLETRDWIRSEDITHTSWYEVLSVSESEVIIRTNYAGSNYTGSGCRKNPEIMDDDTLVTVNCIGLESSSLWINTASLAVKHLLENDSVISNLNTASFTSSNTDAPYVLSMVIPEVIGQDAPIIKDVITKINESVFGSLVTNESFELVYNILTPEKPEDLDILEQHDIIGDAVVKSRNEIVRRVNAKYRPFVDRFTSEDSFVSYGYDNDFVDDYIGSRQELDVILYLYDTVSAEIIAQRYALYNSLSQSVVTVKSKLNLSRKNLNDKISINLDRIYKRFGGGDRKKIGIVNKISTNGSDSTVEFNDLSNIFNRVMSITPNAANDFTSATDAEKIKNGYVVDNDLAVPDTSSDQEIGSNIIG